MTNRFWERVQRLFESKGTRYYGDGGTIHNNTSLDIETDKDGRVVSVWFRCCPLPFKQVSVNDQRAQEMHKMYKQHLSTLHGVEVKDSK